MQTALERNPLFRYYWEMLVFFVFVFVSIHYRHCRLRSSPLLFTLLVSRELKQFNLITKFSRICIRFGICSAQKTINVNFIRFLCSCALVRFFLAKLLYFNCIFLSFQHFDFNLLNSSCLVFQEKRIFPKKIRIRRDLQTKPNIFYISVCGVCKFNDSSTMSNEPETQQLAQFRRIKKYVKWKAMKVSENWCDFVISSALLRILRS